MLPSSCRGAIFLEKILSKNGSAVLYMAHGGTNFGFYSGANSGANESDYKPDLTSYDYDAPIRESGDVDNAKYERYTQASALRRVIAKYSAEPLTSVPLNNKKTAYGSIKLEKTAFLYDIIDNKNLVHTVESENPTSMEAIGQMFGFVLYVSEFAAKGNGNALFIPKVHDRGQVFISCPKDNGKRPRYVGLITRWSNRPINLPYLKCGSRNKLYILVENMGRLNYGQFMFDRKGILSSVYLDGRPLYKWKMLPIPFHNLNEGQKVNSIILDARKEFLKDTAHRKLKDQEILNSEPAFYTGHFNVDKVTDTYISFRGWRKGIAFVNEFNVGRFWPSRGPQCNLYVPAPILREGENILVIFELELPNPNLLVSSVDHPDFTCGLASSKSS
ncbi:Beta-galactosidase 17 [Abeliophyllum distichum]|uniref:beta-galactosidase n=1 Tax=Abeliophyllum distichum TaxID=126358 RepID=A0ABD1RY93_9LAMI